MASITYVLLVSSVIALIPVLPTSQQIFLDPNKKYSVDWELNTSAQVVIFNVTVETQGYVGIGFSKDGKMYGADIVLWTIIDGTNYFKVYLESLCIHVSSF